MLPSMAGAIDLKTGCYLGAALTPTAYSYSSFRSYPGVGYNYPGSNNASFDYMQYAANNSTTSAVSMATNPYTVITSSGVDYWKFPLNN